MKVTFASETYVCTKAIRDGDRATLYLVDGGPIHLSGIMDDGWDKFKFDGGDWKVATQLPSDTERLDALEAAMLALMGGRGMSNV